MATPIYTNGTHHIHSLYTEQQKNSNDDYNGFDDADLIVTLMLMTILAFFYDDKDDASRILWQTLLGGYNLYYEIYEIWVNPPSIVC